MQTPRVLYVSDTRVVPAEALLARIDRAAGLPEDLRARLAVQLRDPELSSRALFALGARLRDRTGALGVRLVVNDRIDLALALGADGVHLGRRSVSVDDARALLGDAAWISVACHDLADVAAARRAGASAVTLSPIFASPGKGAPLGLSALGEAKRALSGSGVGLVALGGIDAGTAGECLAAGADGVAVIRADLGDGLAHLLRG
ncbi:thiamine phosphate synthase [Polyangium aurulentum]|uniref:thiamine phosphate synthase n=1 Tax=Polyangium aurulentum TaxID=2567896 RepID=UPI0010ADD095|nr:thiamine phosphate synthase [Polyangium aurulentum]UQA58209.1 thiamine phosphate synthase [Polyangium aurulentum]